jgi:putative serine/threonine protein kinase
MGCPENSAPAESVIVALEKLREEPYASIICYPRPSHGELEKRLEELRGLHVSSLEFKGEKQVFGVPVLGKGCVGLVVLACRNGKKTALKIRRVDADRSRMQREARLLEKANSVGVGPKLSGVSRNLLLMEYIDGDLLPAWLGKNPKKAKTQAVLREVLEQCFRLDDAGLDHGELSHAPKHIIVDWKDEPFILDFETASLERRPSNVTSVCQFLFVGGTVADSVAEKLGSRNKKTVVEALRRYKTDRSCVNFEKVLKVCGV